MLSFLLKAAGSLSVFLLSWPALVSVSTSMICSTLFQARTRAALLLWETFRASSLSRGTAVSVAVGQGGANDTQQVPHTNPSPLRHSMDKQEMSPCVATLRACLPGSTLSCSDQLLPCGTGANRPCHLLLDHESTSWAMATSRNTQAMATSSIPPVPPPCCHSAARCHKVPW